MTSVLSRQSFDHGVECLQCGEGLTAPAWSGPVSVTEVRNFWSCANCGYRFETLDLLNPTGTLSPDIAEEFLSSLLVA